MKRWWSRKYNRPLNDPLLLEQSRADLELEWMEDHIEDRVAEIEDMTLEKVTYLDLWPEENADDYETILDRIIERMGDDGDLEDAIEEANKEYLRRTGIDRRGK